MPTLPTCLLTSLIESKAAQKSNLDQNYFAALESFCRRVADEIHYANVLFPEYTPHDEHYHLSRLFHVAETLVGREQLQRLNLAELLVFAASLYAHDWGMAVSESERTAVLSGTPTVLRDEAMRLAEFCNRQRCLVGDIAAPSPKGASLWRDYVRETHALRSAERVKQYFVSLNRPLGEAIARTCIGHWLPIEDITDHRSYPLDFSVLSENVNLRAVAIYTRLVDLFDLADDRTPWVLWQFVAPRDTRSQLEWARHRALHPITCPPYLEGRVIRVDGSTDDHEVFAALEDLRLYCEEQLRSSQDALARAHDPRHQLDIYHIEWRVATPTFTPISIRFEFDRNSMFQILSDEIYGDDPYVFLRELLQNSVDAIRSRKEVLNHAGVEPGGIGIVKIRAESVSDSCVRITFQDDGIGMDEYIVREYLAVAGKSFYQSDDFQRLGLTFEPVSQFGVGLLSCFMVADRVEITTRREPYVGAASEALRIHIPAVDRHFRIERIPPGLVGTEVSVFVIKEKWLGKITERNSAEWPPRIADYLATVAAFAPVVTFIEESGRRSVIAPPGQRQHKSIEGFADAKLRQLSYEYPWEVAFLPQDVEFAKSLFIDDVLRVDGDSDLRGFEGAVTSISPRIKDLDYEGASGGYPANDVWVRRRGARPTIIGRLRWNMEWSRRGLADFGEVWGLEQASLRWDAPRSCRVFRDGFMVSRIGRPRAENAEDAWNDLRTLAPGSAINLNLPVSIVPRIDLARREFRGEEGKWRASILTAVRGHIREEESERLRSQNPLERAFSLATLTIHSGCEAVDILSAEELPIAVISRGGEAQFMELRELAERDVLVSPSTLSKEASELFLDTFGLRDHPYDGAFRHYVGPNLVAAFERFGGSAILTEIQRWTRVLGRSHVWTAVRFLQTQSGPPLIASLWEPRAATRSEELTLDGAWASCMADPTPVALSQWLKLRQRDQSPQVLSFFPTISNFPTTLRECLSHGWEVMNAEHHLTRNLVRACLYLDRETILEDKVRLGKVRDIVNSVPFMNDFTVSSVTIEELKARIAQVSELAGAVWQGDPMDIESLTLSSFIADTLVADGETGRLSSTSDRELTLKQSWGDEFKG